LPLDRCPRGAINIPPFTAKVEQEILAQCGDKVRFSLP
jgi:hypothetical protein